MQLALSTNWNSTRHGGGEPIVEEALAAGCDSLELGFRLRPEHVPGIKARLDECPVSSVHAYSPVPISAPFGHPELHSLAAPDADERALAAALLRKTVEFAGSMGARAVVLHAGRTPLGAFLSPVTSDSFRAFIKGRPAPAAPSAPAAGDAAPAPAPFDPAKLTLDLGDPKYARLLARATARRRKRAARLMGPFRDELERLAPLLERHSLVLALENLPYYEAFPDEDGMEEIARDFPRVRAWFDTGHARVRAQFGWSPSEAEVLKRQLPYLAGCHVNDVVNFEDDHFAAGMGGVDFSALAALADARYVHVMEPSRDVSPADLAAGVRHLRSVWGAAAQRPAPVAPPPAVPAG